MKCIGSDALLGSDVSRRLNILLAWHRMHWVSLDILLGLDVSRSIGYIVRIGSIARHWIYRLVLSILRRIGYIA